MLPTGVRRPLAATILALLCPACDDLTLYSRDCGPCTTFNPSREHSGHVTSTELASGTCLVAYSSRLDGTLTYGHDGLAHGINPFAVTLLCVYSEMSIIVDSLAAGPGAAATIQYLYFSSSMPPALQADSERGPGLA
ncbi:hypothetical protein EVG20_g5966 [Dentipellis fragilis]|uniref:Uncharacterized protein n=1 Tax=Dentipellis fragilis TaxID=205917 RepID=A0A4Y9YTE2_9AGAM|nr:hypothetical protein EVG20_g5966 [Dentipellis fragilis]